MFKWLRRLFRQPFPKWSNVVWTAESGKTYLGYVIDRHGFGPSLSLRLQIPSLAPGPTRLWVAAEHCRELSDD